MISFNLDVKEEGKYPESIISRFEEGDKASVLFSKVKEQFADSLVEGTPENQPFLYMKTVPIVNGGEVTAASIIPTAHFKMGIKEEMLDFINKN